MWHAWQTQLLELSVASTNLNTMQLFMLETIENLCDHSLGSG
jgi:hypothetical protein